MLGVKGWHDKMVIFII